MLKFYALLSALFAALTAVFAKVGVQNVNSKLATPIRTTILKEPVSAKVIIGAFLITAGTICIIWK